MEHIADWFVVFTIFIGTTVVIERLSSLVRRQKSSRKVAIVMKPSSSEVQEP